MRTAKTLIDWANAQADLSLRWAHTHFVGFVMSRLICDRTQVLPASLRLLPGNFANNLVQQKSKDAG